jgi:hypothetical protein
MEHPCQYKVRVATKGDSKRPMIAVFAEYIDAVNFAAAESKGRYNFSNKTVIAYQRNGRIALKFRQGGRVFKAPLPEVERWN